jgi:hypothetical protein
VATEGLAAAPVEQQAAARIGKQGAASTGMANTAAEDSLTTAAEVPEATQAEEAMAPAVTVPEEVVTAARRILPRICRRNCHFVDPNRSVFFRYFSLCELQLDKNVIIQCFHSRKHYSFFKCHLVILYIKKTIKKL